MKEKKKRKNRSYSEEFKIESVELAKKIGNAEASRELEISESNIRAWRKKFDPIESKNVIQYNKCETKSTKSYAQLERENKKLSKELGYLKKINEVLKKSTAIFSADHMGD